MEVTLILIGIMLLVTPIAVVIHHFVTEKSKKESLFPIQDKARKIIAENKPEKTIRVKLNNIENAVAAVSMQTRTLLIYGERIYRSMLDTVKDVLIQYLKVIPFENILNCQLLEDNATIMSSSAGSAFVGGLIGGTTGAIIGSSTASSKGMVNSMQLRIDLKDVTKPCYIVQFIPIPMERSTDLYKDVFKGAQEIYATVLAIINLNKERAEQEKAKAEQERAEEAAKQRAEEAALLHAEAEALPASADKQQASVAEQLRECKALLDEGILTQEEFDAKKKSLLGL